MVIDVAMGKYCDLITVERYVAMASRIGIMGLPANCLTEDPCVLTLWKGGGYERLKMR
jgi:hypothetical protein